MIERVNVKLNGRVLTGWTSFRFTQSIDEAASAFEIETTKDPRVLSEDITQSLPITIEANGDLLLTGHLEDFDLNIERETGRQLILRGRSATADIISASVVGSYPQQNTLTYIEQIVAPFGIQVETDGSDWADHVEITPELGQTVLGAIHDALQLQQKTISVTATGQLRIWDAENRPRQGAISIGSQTKVARIAYKSSGQFSEITAHAQEVTQFQGAQASEVNARVSTSFPRYRPKIIFPSTDMDTPKAAVAASRSAARSIGSGFEMTLTTTTWRNSSGQFWEPNGRLWVDVPEINQGGELVIQSIGFTQDRQAGTEAQITLAPAVKFGATDAISANTSTQAAVQQVAQSPTQASAADVGVFFSPEFLGSL